MLKYFFLFTIIFVHINSERNFHVQLTKFDCINGVPGFFKRVTCELSERSNISYLNVWMELRKTVTTMLVHAVLEASMPKRSKLKLLDIKLDGCDFFRSSPKQEIMKRAHKYIMKFINRIPACPMEANFTYFFKDYYVDIEDLPSFTPEVDFRLTMFFLDMNKIEFKLLGEGKVIYNHKVNAMKNIRKKN